jgi:fructose-1,6-bisphosphatase II / sedoheptulose-1,7-bisphosphatase
MKLSKELLNSLISITSNSAIACYPYLGKNEKILADKAATDTMRYQLNKLDIQGEVVIGEGELDEAPMLFIGEKLGNGNGPEIDIAVDPVEGTNFVAKNLPGAMTVLAIAEKGNLLNAPETYMNKIASGRHISHDVLDLDHTVEKNIKNYSDASNKKIEEITVCLLNRPRHNKIIEELKKLRVNIKYISDGDIAGALLVTDKKYGVDIFMGIGGGPEGVIAAAALKALNCKFQGRFLFKSDKEISRAKKMGIKDLNKKYEINEIVKGESIFCATGITTCELMNGIIKENGRLITETIFTHSKSNLELVKKDISIT